MKKIYVPMIRYGDKDFDEGFIGWGFQSYEDQMRDARGVLRCAGREGMKILDLACGLGTYHRVWLDAGHSVTGTDLSETFIFMAQNANGGYKRASYRVENYELLEEEEVYDLVTLIDTPLEEEILCANIHRALKPGGQFIFQVANPNYDHPRGPLGVNYRNWVEKEDHTLLLTRHEYNPEIERWEYEEWLVDIEKNEIVVEHSFIRTITFADLTKMLLAAGFTMVNFVDCQGVPYNLTEENPRNFYCVAYKPERPGFRDVPPEPEESPSQPDGPLFDDNGPVLFDDNGPIGR